MKTVTSSGRGRLNRPKLRCDAAPWSGARFSTSTLGDAGTTHTIVAVFSGDSNFSGSIHNGSTQTLVRPAGQLAAGYAPDLHLVGVAAGAPAPDLIELLKVNVKTTVGRVLIAMALSAWSKVYDGQGARLR